MGHLFRLLFHLAPWLLLAYAWVYFDVGTHLSEFASNTGDWASSAQRSITAWLTPSPYSAPFFHRF